MPDFSSKVLAHANLQHDYVTTDRYTARSKLRVQAQLQLHLTTPTPVIDLVQDITSHGILHGQATRKFGLPSGPRGAA